jgi:hypothetical protein
MLKNEENATTLNGWTKIGDKYIARNKWTLYKHGGTFGSIPWIVKDFPANKDQEAIKTYDKIADTVKKGGFWLVSPDGTVIKQIFKIINKY